MDPDGFLQNYQNEYYELMNVFGRDHSILKDSNKQTARYIDEGVERHTRSLNVITPPKTFLASFFIGQTIGVDIKDQDGRFDIAFAIICGDKNKETTEPNISSIIQALGRFRKLLKE